MRVLGHFSVWAIIFCPASTTYSTDSAWDAPDHIHVLFGRRDDGVVGLLRKKRIDLHLVIAIGLGLESRGARLLAVDTQLPMAAATPSWDHRSSAQDRLGAIISPTAIRPRTGSSSCVPDST